MTVLSAGQAGLALLFTTSTILVLIGHFRSDPSFSRAYQSLANKIAPQLNIHQPQSVYLFLLNVVQFGAVMMYVYIGENAPPHHHGEKSYDRDVFFLLTGMLFVSAFTTIKANGGMNIVEKKNSTSSDDEMTVSRPKDR